MIILMWKFRWRTICLMAIVFTLLISCAPDVELTSLSSPTQPATSERQPIQTLTVEPTATRKPTPVVELTLPPILESNPVINYWHPWSGEMANLVLELTREFNENNIYGITVNAISHADERVLIEDLENAREETSQPDLVTAPNDYLQQLINDEVYIRDFNDLISSNVWGVDDEWRSSFFPIFWNANEKENYRWGLPAYWSGHYLAYNRTWANELGFSERPEFIDDFREQACAAASQNLYDGNPNSNGTGGYIYSTDGAAILAWMRAFGGVNPQKNTDTWAITQVEEIAASEFLYDLYLDDCAWTGRLTQPYQYFSSRLALFYSAKLEDILIQNAVNQKNSAIEDAWTLIPYPTQLDKPVVFLEGSSYAILAEQADNAVASWEFIKWMLEPENQARMVEVSASFPLSTTTLPNLEDFRITYPAWNDALQFLALAERVPENAGWQFTKDVMSDYAWQLIQFTTRKEDIPDLLTRAHDLIDEQ